MYKNLIFFFFMLCYFNMAYSQNFREVFMKFEWVKLSNIDMVDFDNDGDMDIFVGGVRGSGWDDRGFTKLYENLGSGYWRVRETDIPTVGAEFPSTWNVEYFVFKFADINNDSFPDLAISMRPYTEKNGYKGWNYTNVFINDNGNFISMGRNFIQVYNGDIDWGDLDNDGDLDLLISGEDGRYVYAKLYKNDNLNFTELPPADSIFVNSWGPTRFLDYNKDGNLDILMVGWGGSDRRGKILKGNGDGTFTNTNIDVIGLMPCWADVGDFNSDGYDDFVLMGQLGRDENFKYVIYLYLNNKNGNFIPINLSSYGISPLEGGSIQMVDFDRDGNSDIFITGKDKDTNKPQVKLFKNEGNLIFTKVELKIPGVVSGSGILKDFNNDGFLDIAITGEMDNEPKAVSKLYINKNNKEWVEYGLIDLYNSFALPCDFDNDGDYDILMTGKTLVNEVKTIIYRNNGKNNFEIVDINFEGIYNDNKGIHIDLADVDGNGYVDFIITGKDKNNNDLTKLYLNKGNFKFEDVTNKFSLPQESNASVIFADFDNSGYLDLLITGKNTNNYISMFKNENGNLVLKATNLPAFSEASLYCSDFENDGDFDIISFKTIKEGWTYKRKAILYKNDGNGEFKESTIILDASNEPYYIWADYDNDGFSDLFIDGRIYRNLNGDTLININAAIQEGRISSAIFGDLDNDGDVDLIYTFEDYSGWGSTGTMCNFYRNDGYGTFTKLNFELPSFANGNLTLFDYDNDGDLDIFYVGDNSYTRLFENTIEEKNHTPSTPTGLMEIVKGHTVTLQWNSSIDNETPSPGLTYNIAVRKDGDKTWIVPPMADTSNGFRYVVKYGNVGHNTKWVLKNLSPGTYYWRVQAIDNNFAGSEFSVERKFVVGTTSINDSNVEISRFELFDNYPNPFNPTTTITYNIPKTVNVFLAIYNISGQLVKILVNEKQTSGQYSIKWDGRDKNGKFVGNGLYIYQLKADGFVKSKKMILLK